MNSTILLQKLIDIERSIGIDTESSLRRKVLDAEECLLQMHADLVERLRVQSTAPNAQRFTLLEALSKRNESQGQS